MKDSFHLTARLIAQQWVQLACLFVVGCMVNLTVADALQTLTPTEETQRWVMQLALGLWDMLEGILVLLVLSWGVPKVRPITAASMLEKPFATPYIGSFVAEFLRVLAQILMWGLLLILPGVYRYAQLIFVSWITLFSKEYRSGKIDALELSKRLVKGRMVRIFVVLTVTTALELLCDYIPEMAGGFHGYFSRITFAFLSMLVAVWGFSLIYLLFEKAMEDVVPNLSAEVAP